MRIPLLLAMVAAVALAACDRVTAVRLEVQHDPAWALDAIELSARDRTSTIAPASTIEVLIPDDWAGEPVAIALVGTTEGAARAAGEVEVVPMLGETVRARVTLAPLACGVWCTEGSVACAPGGVVTCEERDGCMAWSDPVACSPDEPYCSLGTCAATCVDECATGETRCDGPGAVLVCGQADDDPCSDWQPSVACSDGEVCSNGRCDVACTDECAADAVTCVGSGQVRCGDRNLDGCLEWGPVEACPSGTTCSGGACAATCTDDCAAPACDGLAFRACGNYDLDACLDWSPGTSCVSADPCVEGACSVDGCATTPRVCDDPPEPTCLDASTRRVFDPIGTCTATGGCEYTSRDVACPNCPDCDACVGVTCDDPPDPTVCYEPVGTCDDGACTYAWDDGEQCDDGDACTVDDTCASGACAGDALDCGEPPPPTCVDSLTRRTFGPGVCTGGACAFPHTDTACNGVCNAGACSCPESTCARSSVANGAEENPSDLILDDTHIYWTTWRASQVKRRLKTSSTVEVIADGTGGQWTLYSLAVDSTHVYWVDDYVTLKRRAKSGGSVETIHTIGGIGPLNYIRAVDVSDPVDIYWYTSAVSDIQRRPKAGGAVTTLPSTPGAVDLAIDATHVYWVTADSVRRRHKTTGEIEVLATGQESAKQVALDATHAYWTVDDADTGRVMRVAKVGGSAEVFAANQDGASALFVDATHVYWTDNRNYTAMRKAKAGGTPEVLDDETIRREGIAADARHVYWTRSSDTNGSVVRLSRCACGL